MTNKYMYVFGPSSFVTALATKKVQTCRKVDKSLTMGQESTYLIVLLEIAISELKNQYALIKSQILHSLSFSGFGSRLMHTTPLHFDNFVTVRAAKSMISSKCVFNPSYGLPGVFKIKILYLDLILDQF